jgi:uncharacterized membrane protein YdbT with pleckstrin-like domain
MKTVDTDRIQFIIKPSQWVNIIWFIMAVGAIFSESPLMAIPQVLWFWHFLVISCWKYQFGEKTITERKGVLSIEKVQVHYFRIKSMKTTRSFFQRLVGLSTIDIITSEPFRPYLRLYSIGNGDGMRRYINDKTEYWRSKMGVKETDFHSF